MQRRLTGGERGFTLIELLIVILAIGILAAIAIPMFIGKRGNAEDADAKSNARNLVSQVDSCFAVSEDFTQCTGRDVADPDNALPWGTGPGEVTVASATKTSYEVVAISHARTGAQSHTFTIRRALSGGMARTCTAGASVDGGGCRNGTW